MENACHHFMLYWHGVCWPRYQQKNQCSGLGGVEFLAGALDPGRKQLEEKWRVFLQVSVKLHNLLTPKISKILVKHHKICLAATSTMLAIFCPTHHDDQYLLRVPWITVYKHPVDQ